MTPAQIERLPHVPPMYRGIFERCYNGTASRPDRYRAKCLDCCCYQRVEVTQCGATACPLWDIRPYQDGSLEEIEPASGPISDSTAPDSQREPPPFHKCQNP